VRFTYLLKAALTAYRNTDKLTAACWWLAIKRRLTDWPCAGHCDNASCDDAVINHSKATPPITSARQPWYIGRNSLNRPPLRIAQRYERNVYTVEKYFQCATTPSLTMRVYLHSFSRCCLPNMRTSTKFR